MSIGNTAWGAKEIDALLAGKRRLWFVGVGGVHMAALARLALEEGFSVRGSDHVENEQVRKLREAGISVRVGHGDEGMENIEALVYTLAISPDNPEYRYAKSHGIPVISRADFLGFLMRRTPCRIGVSGSHGKSTVTSMLGEIFSLAGRAPTVVCGATMRRFGSAFVQGTGQDLLFEACEYKDSFLRFSPTVSLILNAELDHTDYFRDKAALLRSFGAFAELATKAVLLPQEDGELWEATKHAKAPRLTFGWGEKAHYRGIEPRDCEGGARFFFVPRGERPTLIALPVRGEHTIKNALAAAATAHACGVETPVIEEALSRFRGVARRMEYKGRLRGARVYDDYAHHPTEVEATLKVARKEAKGRVVAVFQSHTYSRTKAFLQELALALSKADAVFIPDVYAAREQESDGANGAALAAAVGARARYTGGLSTTATAVLEALRPDDLLVVMGAGDVGDIFAEFSAKGFTLDNK